MKNRAFLLLFPILILESCRANRSVPDRSMWDGTVELREGISVPFRMNLDFSGARPTGYFLVGDEKTPIPEISKNGDSLMLGFSEYSAAIRSTWNGRQLIGSYLRIRSDGTKSLKFTASPEISSSNAPAAEPARVPLPSGNYQVFFQGERK